MMQLISESPRTPYRVYPIWIVQSWKSGGGSWLNATTSEQRRQTKNGAIQARRKLMQARPFIAQQDVWISLSSDKTNQEAKFNNQKSLQSPLH